jgi:hypothetical protein
MSFNWGKTVKISLASVRFVVLSVAMVASAGVANAQVTIDMANIRCEQYLAMPVAGLARIDRDSPAVLGEG